jgi:carbon-monoxide dehydrogenase iron sulfur subunit/anaerobic dimethyl sulfoxide reductase subunit B (iron-sulfur subunit)
VVSCKDQHYDVDEQGPALRKALRYENEDGVIKCMSIGCMHCADAPCMAACPTGAIYRDEETSLVQVDSSACIGCRSCLMACPFGAPKFTADNRMTKCDGCIERVKRGLEPVCVKTCPNHLISLVPDTKQMVVACSNRDKGAVTRKVCSAGCIGCKKCERVCPSGAIKVKDNVAVIDYEKCTDCGACAKACTTQCIKREDLRGCHQFEA